MNGDIDFQESIVPPKNEVMVFAPEVKCWQEDQNYMDQLEDHVLQHEMFRLNIPYVPRPCRSNLTGKE